MLRPDIKPESPEACRAAGGEVFHDKPAPQTCTSEIGCHSDLTEIKLVCPDKRKKAPHRPHPSKQIRPPLALCFSQDRKRIRFSAQRQVGSSQGDKTTDWTISSEK